MISLFSVIIVVINWGDGISTAPVFHHQPPEYVPSSHWYSVTSPVPEQEEHHRCTHSPLSESKWSSTLPHPPQVGHLIETNLPIILSQLLLMILSFVSTRQTSYRLSREYQEKLLVASHLIQDHHH